MNLTVKDIPKELHARLRHVAESNGRSVNKEILHTLDSALMPKKVTSKDIFEKARLLRVSIKTTITDKMIEDAIQEGRK